MFGVVDGFHLFHLSFGIVGDDELHGVQYGGYAGGAVVQVLAHGAFQQGEFIKGVVCGIANLVDELMDGLRRVTATAKTADGRHTGVVPTVYQAFLDQHQQVALAHQRIAEVQFVELILMGAVIVEVFAFLHPVHEEVVERTVGHKLQCAERVCHAFEEVALSVGEVVHRISLPSGTRAMVRMLHYTVDDGVAEVHVGACHVYLGTEHHGTFLNLAAVHLLE